MINSMEKSGAGNQTSGVDQPLATESSHKPLPSESSGSPVLRKEWALSQHVRLWTGEKRQRKSEERALVGRTSERSCWEGTALIFLDGHRSRTGADLNKGPRWQSSPRVAQRERATARHDGACRARRTTAARIFIGLTASLEHQSSEWEDPGQRSRRSGRLERSAIVLRLHD